MDTSIQLYPSSTKPYQQVKPKKTFVDYVAQFLNLCLIFARSRKVSNFKLANIYTDATEFAHQIASGQYFKIYGRITSKYNYHKLQRFDNAVRSFDVKDYLAKDMLANGNFQFYATTCPNTSQPQGTNFTVDMTTLASVSTVTTSADYLQTQLYIRAAGDKASGKKAPPHPDKPKQARQSYVRGYSRVISALDYDDWERFRQELRDWTHTGVGLEDKDYGRDVMLVALSYKSKEVKISRKMRLLNEDGSEAEDEGVLYQEAKQMTTDFLNDFRWSQVVRSCMTLAKERNMSGVRIWIDRLVMMNIPKENIKEIYKVVDWEDFGLFAYAVCPVVRVYDDTEREFGTDFWRKLEAVMGVAGHGLLVDDYLIRQYDTTILYGPSLYRRLQNGLAVIGGGGIYVRTGTLAVATAVLTDGVSVSAVNEDKRTKDSISGWKSWALRTISEGAYSASHSVLMFSEKPYDVTLRDFQVIAFWESMVSHSQHLQGNSYLDASFQRASQWKSSSRWDGIIEWLGMLSSSCSIHERETIMRFLRENAEVQLYAATTGHVASLIYLHSSDNTDKRVLAVDLSRFSTGRQGHVTGIAEATGLWNGKIKATPWLTEFDPEPDVNQCIDIDEEGRLTASYQEMKVVWIWEKYFSLPIVSIILLIATAVGILIYVIYAASTYSALVVILEILLFIPTILVIGFKYLLNNWPWIDENDVGEGLFVNLLNHGLFDAKVKSQYRELKSLPYDEIRWH